jgi:hypothetical protein
MAGPNTHDLGDALRARLDAAGWSLLDPDTAAALQDGSGDMLARLIRPLGDGFRATGAVSGSTKRGGGIVVTQLFAGISYAPLDRLLPLLGAPDLYDLVSDGVLPRSSDGSAPEPIEISTSAQLATTADALARLILDRSAALIDRYTTVDALVEYLGESRERHRRGAALLAAAGRFDEARNALDTFEPRPVPERLFRQEQDAERDRCRFRRQLLRWIDSNGSIALPTEQPPPNQARDARPTRAVVIEAWNVGKAKSDAIKAVERVAGGKTRAELHAMVEDELARRGAVENPVEIEQQIDDLLYPGARRRQAVEVLRRVGRGLQTSIRDRTFPDLRLPSWLAPPERAVYAVSRVEGAPRAAVRLDDDATDWLARAHAEIPAPAGIEIEFDAWLDWDEHDDARQLAVHIGERRVGTPDPPSAAAFARVMNEAALREELPYTVARLVLHPEVGYILEIQLPTRSERSQR